MSIEALQRRTWTLTDNQGLPLHAQEICKLHTFCHIKPTIDIQLTHEFTTQ